MSLLLGTQLGNYRILALIGSGGMGEVYRAQDPRLGREVAIKVLPEGFTEDRERLRRFELEARAAGALNHPNIVAVHDLGSYDGSPYLVMELLDGETLRARMGGRPMPARKAAEIALQVAQGLAAAHEKGILHRDLKPENLFLTRDGRVKILDFGLARQQPGRIGQNEATRTLESAAGSVVGTTAYMSPEQVQGEPLDGRSDLFALGVVLRELLTGRHPFQGHSAIDTLHAILHQDPPALDPALQVPPALERVLDACLAKEPAGRFHAAHDLAFALAGISQPGSSASGPQAPVRDPAWRRRGLLGAFAVGLAVAGALGAAAWALLGRAPGPRAYAWSALTFQQGIVTNARFGQDGRTIYFSAAWNGEPVRVYSQTEGALATPLPELPPGHLLSVSVAGEIAFLDTPDFSLYGLTPGSLHVLRPGAGLSRPVAKDVIAADFAPGGKDLAIAIRDPGKLESRVEFPLGQVVYRTSNWITHLRVSPDRHWLALVERLGPGLTAASIRLVEAQGAHQSRLLWKGGCSGILWDPAGKNLWVMAMSLLLEVDLQGRVRYQTVQGVDAMLLDRDAMGGLLFARYHLQAKAAFFETRETPRDLSWLDFTNLKGLSSDGRLFLFVESSAGGYFLGGLPVYVRSTEGGPPRLIGMGWPQALSPDGSMALVANAAKTTLQRVPTGPGEAATVATAPPGGAILNALFTPEGRVVWSEDPGDGSTRSWILGAGTERRPFAPEGYRPVLLGEGGWAILSRQQRNFLWRGGAGAPSALPFKDLPQGWLGHEALLLMSTDPGVCQVERYDLATGARRPWMDLRPTFRGGLFMCNGYPCREGKAWLVGYAYADSILGVARPTGGPS